MTAMRGELPTGKLEGLYSSPTGSDLDADLKRLAADAPSFAEDYRGRVASFDGKALSGAVARFAALTEPQILYKRSNKDAEVCRDAAKSFAKMQGDIIAVISLVTNTLAKDKKTEEFDAGPIDAQSEAGRR
jgi:hypothetical protein